MVGVVEVAGVVVVDVVAVVEVVVEYHLPFLHFGPVSRRERISKIWNVYMAMV